jgi:hypothetical protein
MVVVVVERERKKEPPRRKLFGVWFIHSSSFLFPFGMDGRKASSKKEST